MARSRSEWSAERRFEHRWRELTGREYRPGGRIPKALVTSIETLQQGKPPAAGPPGPTFVFVRRKNLGRGCDKSWEIAGWYSAPVPCIGAPAVLAALNAAAGALCSKLCGQSCPPHCKCIYTPQAALGAYTCGATVEEGFLLQAAQVWNCNCLEQ